MRGDRVQRTQQDAETFMLRPGITGVGIGLEVFQRVEHLHRARDDGVVLHALVVVVDLLEHAVHLASQL
jgi:hypothetical protein